MYLLYTKPTCVFSRAVEEYADKSGIPYEKRDITASDTFKRELLAYGGKIRTPFFLDSDTGLGMYESKAIIKYLEEHSVHPLSNAHHDPAISQGTCRPEFQTRNRH
jgi:glutathione S-transferase